MTLYVANTTPVAPTLLAPADGALGRPYRPTFTWTAAPYANTYDIQIATDPTFNNVVDSAAGLTGTSYTPLTDLAPATTYYWRVRAVNGCDATPSAVFSFTTWSGGFIVNTTLDAVDAVIGDRLCATAGGQCSLRAAVQEANALTPPEAVTITVPAGTYLLTIPGSGEEAAATGDLDLKDGITLVGAGADVTIIDGNHPVTGDRVFHVLYLAAITIEGVTIQGGQESSGGGIYNDGTLTVTLSTISGNTDTGGYLGGGGIFVTDNGNLSLESSTVAHNTASGVWGGGIACDSFDLDVIITIRHSAIISNTADGAAGLYICEGSLTTIENSTIAGNTALDSSGGGLYNNGTLTITNSVIAGNTAVNGGGLTISDLNEFYITTIRNAAIYSNTATDSGGGLSYDGGVTHIIDSAIYGNIAVYGGGIYKNEDKLFVLNSTISGNTATEEGGGIKHAGACCSYGESRLWLSNVTITDNNAARVGGLYNGWSTTYLENTLIANNSAPSWPDCRNNVTSNGYNLLGNNDGCTIIGGVGDQIGTPDNPIDPLLGPLQDNGGPTLTQALLPNSPAIDAGEPAGCRNAQGQLLTTDQRGFVRPADGDGNGSAICDIGAYELGADAVPAYCRAPNLTIPDNSPPGVTDTLTISDMGALMDLDISLLVGHPYVGDLVFDLEHVETGITVRLIERPGGPPPPYCNGDDIDATLDDEASSPVEDACAPSEPTISGSFMPNNPLSAFDGQDLSGTWRLTARDVGVNGLGTLVQWCVEPEVAP